MAKPRLSVVINTKNAAATLESTLKSVSFADEVVVADMQSHDETVEIARAYADRVISVADVGYVEPARNQAITAASGEWVLVVDADEVIPPSLAARIGQITAVPYVEDQPAAYFIARKNMLFGHWVEHSGWWPDYVMRLFRNGSVTWADSIHSVPVVSGDTDYLPAEPQFAIIHWNYRSLHEYLERLNRYTGVQAKELEPVGHSDKAETKKAQHRSYEVLARFRREFLSRLFARNGLEAGSIGVGLSLMQGVSDSVVELKRLELAGGLSNVTTAREFDSLLKELTQFEYELSYWLFTTKIARAQGLSKLWYKLSWWCTKVCRLVCYT